MAKVIPRYCPTCGENTKHVHNGPNHVLHLLMAIVTGGLWIVVWILLSIGYKFVCDRCGALNKKDYVKDMEKSD